MAREFFLIQAATALLTILAKIGTIVRKIEAKSIIF